MREPSAKSRTAFSTATATTTLSKGGDFSNRRRMRPKANPRGLGFYKTMTQVAKPVIAIAGPYKLAALRAALKGKLFNVLVTDEHTARELAQQH